MNPLGRYPHERIECSNCDGEGYIIDKLVAVGTLGMSIAIGWLMSNGDKRKDFHKVKCGRCDGTGVEP